MGVRGADPGCLPSASRCLAAASVQSARRPFVSQIQAAAPQAVQQDAPQAAPQKALHPRGRLCLVLLALLGFVLGCSEFVVIGIEPQIAAGLGVPLARTGELVSWFALTYAVLTPVLALATGRFRRFPLLVTYMVIFNLGNLLMMVAPTFEVLLAARVVLGAVSGALLALGVTYVPELVPARRVSMSIALIYGAFSVAMVLSTSLGKMIAETFDWHATMAAVFVVGLVSGIAILAVMPRAGATDEPATVREQLRLLRDPRILSGMAIFVFGVGSVYVFYAFITPYLEDVLGLTPLTASAVLMAYGGVCLASNLLSGWADARFGLKALVAVFPVQALILLGIFWAGSNTPTALALVFALALSMYILSTPCVSLFMRVATNEHPKALTLAGSVEPMAFNVGIAFGTAVGSAVVAGPGMGYVGLVGAAFSLAALGLSLLTLALVRRARARREQAGA